MCLTAKLQRNLFNSCQIHMIEVNKVSISHNYIHIDIASASLKLITSFNDHAYYIVDKYDF